MRIGIIGAGALGLYYGAVLQRAGHDLHFLLRRDFEAIHQNGLKVLSVNGDFQLREVKGYVSPEEMGKMDLVIVGLKTFANHRFSELITPLLDDNTLILTLQNGLGNEESLAELFGADRIIGGVAFLCANRGEPGVVQHLGEGRIIIGEYGACRPGRIEGLGKIFHNAGIPCKPVAELKKARWEKLVWNIPFNGICALMSVTVEALLANHAAKQLVVDIMHEVIRGGNAQPIKEKIKDEFAAGLVKFSEGLGAYKPSMLIDRLEGRTLELDAIFKIPLRTANEKGISMPKVEELYALLELSEEDNKV